MQTFFMILAWVVAAEAAAWPGYRVARLLFPVNGVAAALAAPVGLLAVAWPVWAAGEAGLPFTPAVIGAVWLALTVATIYFPPSFAPTRSDLKGYLLVRLASLVLFGLYLLFRAKDPQIMGVEKFMDMGFLTTLARTDALPPYDMWLAGQTASYYYFGHLVWALLHKVAQVPTHYGYQFAVAGQFAMTGLGAYGVGLLVTGSHRAGWLAGWLTLMAGNVWTIWQWLAEPGQWDWWKGTRLIPGAITEYPAFTFALGDLHAHLMALPLTMVTLAGLIRWRDTGERRHALFVAACLTGLLMTNTWDYLTYVAVGGAFLLSGPVTKERGLHLLAMALLPPLLAFPYLAGIESPVSGIQVVPQDVTTPVSIFLLLYGPAMLAALVATGRYGLSSVGAGIAAGAVVAGFLRGSTGITAMILLTGLGVLAALGARERGERTAAVLFAASFALMTGCELIYVNDLNGGINERFNTVFKFHYAAWMMTGAALAATLWRWAGDGRAWVRRSAWGATVILLVITAAFPVRIVAMRAGFPHFTLDGNAYLTPGERAIVARLKETPGTPVIVEAGEKAYTKEARISVNTGLPSVIGWWNHELTWRGDWPPLDERMKLVRALYEKGDRAVLDRFGVAYVVCGGLERESFGATACDRLPEAAERVLSVAGEGLWRVRPGEK
ncbi:MAG: hypothetical protein HQK87_03910 [Nitrospinae bacterium]|nr:hypothetical protein [Nitrospinota bacterium]